MRIKFVVAFLLISSAAGCGGGSTPQAAPTEEGSQLKFAQCMRAQGLTWFPDPGADGGLTVSVPEGTDQRKYEEAEKACRAYAPGGGQAGRPLSEEDFTKLRQMSQCIRDHGFAEYPDPDANGGITIDAETTGIAPDDPDFQRARRECQKHLPPRTGGS